MTADGSAPVEPDVSAPPFAVLSGGGLVLRCLRQRDVDAHLAGEDDDRDQAALRLGSTSLGVAP